MNKIILTLIVILTSNVYAIKYYQGVSGSVKSIDGAAFDQCAKVYYRNVAKNDLSPNHQKNLVKATLKGELVNDGGAVAQKLKSENGACTYSDNAENLN